MYLARKCFTEAVRALYSKEDEGEYVKLCHFTRKTTSNVEREMVINPEEFLFPFVKYSHVFILSGPSHRDDEEKSFLKISFCKFIFKKAAGRLSQKGKIMIN